MSGDPYLYPGTTVLRNKLDLRDPAILDRAERRLVAQRMLEAPPRGAFDLDHLRVIHRHLFQDVYEWAGEIRTVEISKGGNQFQLRQFMETGMQDVHRRLVAARHLRRLSADEFASRAGHIIGDVNYVHPFREGNGRAQLEYLRQLADNAGHRLDLRRLDGGAWLNASREAHYGRYEAMGRCIRDVMTA